MRLHANASTEVSIRPDNSATSKIPTITSTENVLLDVWFAVVSVWQLVPSRPFHPSITQETHRQHSLKLGRTLRQSPGPVGMSEGCTAPHTDLPVCEVRCECCLAPLRDKPPDGASKQSAKKKKLRERASQSSPSKNKIRDSSAPEMLQKASEIEGRQDGDCSPTRPRRNS